MSELLFILIFETDNRLNPVRSVLLISVFLLPFLVFGQQKVDSLWKSYSSTDRKTEKAEILRQLGSRLLTSDLDSGSIVSKMYLDFARENALKKHQGYANILIGRSYAWRADFDSAAIFYKRSESIFKELKNLKGLSDCYLNYGGIYYDQANFVKTIEFWEKALAIDEYLNDSLGISVNLNNLGEVYSHLQNHKRAEEYHRRSIHIDSLLNNEHGLAYGYMNWGHVALENGNAPAALWRYKKAQKIFRELDDKRRIATSYSNIGSVYYQTGEYFQALEQFKLSLKAWEISKDRWGIAEVKTQIAETYQEMGNRADAFRFALMAYQEAKEIGARNLVMRSASMLSDMYAERKNYGKAHEYLSIHSKLKDSVFSQSARDDVTRMQLQTQYDIKTLADSLKTAKEQALADMKFKNTLARKNRWIWIGLAGTAVLLFVIILIFRAYRNKKRYSQIIQDQKEKVEFQHSLLEEKNNDILSSIEYAKKIQELILPNDISFDKQFENHFILYWPKDIIGGDFYWTYETEKYSYWSVIDCTGHGVPGALVSMVANNMLNKTIKEMKLTSPAAILNKLTELIQREFSKDGKTGKDGMDMSLCRLDKNSREIVFAGAYNNGILLRNGEITELKATRKPIGFSLKAESFEETEIGTQKGDQIYLFSDGYADQFGGPKGKKFKTKNLKLLLQKIASLKMEEQGKKMAQTLENWKGDLEQVDDVCVIGVRI